MRFHPSHILRVAAIAAFVLFAAFASHAGASAVPASGIDLRNLDRTCKPCTDFYQFANGGWLRRNPIPASYPAYSTFQKLADRNQVVLHRILDAAAADRTAKRGTNEQKIGAFYASCMNTAAIDRAGIEPIDPLLSLADSARPSSLATALARLRAAGVAAFFDFGPGADFTNSRMTIAQLRQGGLGLPDPAYYLAGDARTRQIRQAYRDHVARMFVLLGDSPDRAEREARSVLFVETALARHSMTRVQMRNPANVYHKIAPASLANLAPEIDWKTFFSASGVPWTTPANVAQPAFFKALGAAIATMRPADLHAYLRWRVVHAYAAALPHPFEAADFDFYGKTLEGTPVQEPRWKRCVRATDRALGEALGQFYVAQTFPPAAKARALAMVKNIEATLRSDFSTLEWMTPQTRRRAVAKLDAFLLKIGYPDKWRDYASLHVARGPYAVNQLAVARFENADAMARIGHPVDRNRWGMTPPTVNAYYSPTINEIVFPAGILQPPFFNKDADMAVNYGAIGAVIGHESTHGFDDEGRKFDLNGNLSDWWTPADAARFTQRARCIVKQWNQLSPEPGVYENGAQVEGEEIADLGGLTIAYKAFETWQAHHPRLTIDGFSPEQRFFLGWAHVWAGSQRAQLIALRAKTDVHGYDKFRVNQTLSDMPQFASAFFCKLNDPMVRPKNQQCQIW